MTIDINIDRLADCPVPGDRKDSLAILSAQDESRVPQLVPVRHERMAETAFSFYRGAAGVMAADLAATPTTGIITQLCGDAHLSNFGLFRSPERTMVFDLNDFDETHPGPFEWDVKRLAASFVVAAEECGFAPEVGESCARTAAKHYRRTIAESVSKTALECWYQRIDADYVERRVGSVLDTAAVARTQKILKKASNRDSEQAVSKLCYFDLSGAHIRHDPPLLVPAREAYPGMDVNAKIGAFVEQYRESLSTSLTALFDQYRFIEAAHKVVGVGSVGTRCWIALFGGYNLDDPLFLQIKEAQASVLAEYVPGYDYPSAGDRVVTGQRILQASSDVLLGWVRGQTFDGAGVRDFYVRQLRDGKGSVVVEAFDEAGLSEYARLCGIVLGQAHARTGARHAIAAALSCGKAFDKAIATFAVNYADINRADHARLVQAIADGTMTSAPLTTGLIEKGAKGTGAVPKH